MVERDAYFDILDDWYTDGDYEKAYRHLQRHLRAENIRAKLPRGGRRRPGAGGPPRKKRHKKTAYQSAYSAAYKRLKKKHPRMSFGSLSKKAHAAARKKVK